jgi:transposase-like protein
MKKNKRHQFSDEEKKRGVEDYVSGRKSAQVVADEFKVPVGYVYKWRVQFDEKAKGARIDELEAQGISAEAARIIEDQRAEIEEYRKALAQQVVINDLLKKLQPSTSSQRESELTGLINITKKLARSKGPAKR